jgi:hypothetical protein
MYYFDLEEGKEYTRTSQKFLTNTQEFRILTAYEDIHRRREKA